MHVQGVSKNRPLVPLLVVLRLFFGDALYIKDTQNTKVNLFKIQGSTKIHEYNI